MVDIVQDAEPTESSWAHSKLTWGAVRPADCPQGSGHKVPTRKRSILSKRAGQPCVNYVGKTAYYLQGVLSISGAWWRRRLVLSSECGF